MYVAECVAEVATRIFTADAPSYAVIIEIDRNVREFPILDRVALIASSTSGDATLSSIMGRPCDVSFPGKL